MAAFHLAFLAILTVAAGNPIDKVPEPVDLTKAEVCCADLGCFNSGGDFWSLPNRPISSVPNCNLLDKLDLHLNTRENPVNTEIITPYDTATIAASHFNPQRPTKIITHGFLDTMRWPWWTASVRELLESGDFNVIRMDWSHGNFFPYTQATANTRLVGAYIGRFILHLRDVYNVDPETVHLIGHSLGAQASGYAGEYVVKAGSQVGRITGLDPAGPYFNGMPETVRLDPSDAKVVDTIVTDGEGMLNTGLMPGFGTAEPMGHINFYPNGGKDQPGCEDGLLSPIFNGPTMNTSELNTIGSIAATALELVACNHARAVVLFYESINNRVCQMKSYECDSYESFLRGDCFRCSGGKCTPLGYHADTNLAEAGKQKNYYTITMDRAPFCTNPHRLTITLQPRTSQNNARDQDGWIYVTLYGRLGTSEKIQLNEDSMELEPGKSYTFFFETPQDLGTIQSIVFYWEADTFLLNPFDWFRTNYIYLENDIHLMEVDEVQSVFQLPRNQIEEEMDALAVLISTHRGHA